MTGYEKGNLVTKSHIEDNIRRPRDVCKPRTDPSPTVLLKNKFYQQLGFVFLVFRNCKSKNFCFSSHLFCDYLVTEAPSELIK